MNISFSFRNRVSEKERVAEETPISEVRKCSRLLTPVNSLIDQLHHCVVGLVVNIRCNTNLNC